MLGQKIVFGIILAQSVTILLLFPKTTEILNLKYPKIIMKYSLPSFSFFLTKTNQVQNHNSSSKMNETTINMFRNYNLTQKGSLWPIQFLPRNYTQTDKDNYENQALGNNRVIQLLNYGIEASKNNYSLFNVTRKKLIYIGKLYRLDFYRSFVQGSHFCFKYSACELTNDAKRIPDASAVVSFDYEDKLRRRLKADQIYVTSTREAPSWFNLNLPNYPKFDSRVWIANYRSDADIVVRYGLWTYFDPRVRQKQQDMSYAKGKTKLVMALISHCPTWNRRMEYVKALSKFISVDVYGKVNKKNLLANRKMTVKTLSIYKFFLAFENSNCREYITEKVFHNSFQANTIPIVLGAHPKDYANQLPENSYIVLQNYKSAKELATYLNYLDKNETAYNEYFRWRGTGQFLNYSETFPCTLCSMLFYDEQIERRPPMKKSFQHWNEHIGDGTRACKPKRVGPNLCHTWKWNLNKSTLQTEKLPPFQSKQIWW